MTNPLHDDDSRRDMQAEARERRVARFTTKDAREFVTETTPEKLRQATCEHVWRPAAMSCLIIGHTTMRCTKCGIETCKRKGGE